VFLYISLERVPQDKLAYLEDGVDVDLVRVGEAKEGGIG
jgi:hypothetical protein